MDTGQYFGAGPGLALALPRGPVEVFTFVGFLVKGSESFARIFHIENTEMKRILLKTSFTRDSVFQLELGPQP
jgi:hypothetical protein